MPCYPGKSRTLRLGQESIVGENDWVSRSSPQLGAADLADRWFDPICALYDDVFSAAPFHWQADESQLHRGRLTRLLDDPSFGIVVAQANEELVGFAYGVAVPACSTRWSRVHGDLNDEVTREWAGRTFLLFDYAVRADSRGRGVGRALHDRLLRSRGEQRATLTVQPTALATKRLYERWGWRMVGKVDGGPGAAAPSFDVYLRDPITART